MKKLIIAVTLLAGACASHETGPIANRDQLAVRMESIAAEQRAGARAKQGCGTLGLQENKYCEGDLARADLNISPTTELPRFTGIAE